MSELIFDEEERRYQDFLRGQQGPKVDMPANQVDEEEQGYADFFKQKTQDRQEVLRQSLLEAVKDNPEQRAKIENLSKQTGIAQDVVERNLADIIVQTRTKELQDAAKFSPILSEQLSNPDFAKVAFDDTPSLSVLEQVLTKGRDYAGELGRGVVGNVAGSTLTGFGELYGVATRQLEGLLDQVLPNSAMSFLRTPIPWYLSPEQILKRPGNELKDFGEMIGAPKERRGLDTDVVAGIGQLGGQIAAHLLTGGLSSTGMLTAQGADIMAEKTREDKAPQAQKDAAIVAGAGITALTERLGLDAILNRVPPEIRNRTLRFLADKAAAFGIEFAQETAEGLLHDLTRRVFTNESAPILEGALQEGTAAGLAAAIVRTALGVRGFRASQQQEQFFKALADSSANSKLRQRVPERFKELMERLTASGPVQNVYIPADQFRTFYQSQGVDPAAKAAEFGARNYDEALAAGTDIVIPAADFATYVAPTDDLQGLIQDVRLGQGELTSREFAVFQADQEARMAEIEAQAQAIMGEAQSPAFEQIKQGMLGQLVGTGYEQGTADAYATVYAKTITNMAERAGMDPVQLHDRYSLSVNRPLPDVLTTNPGAGDIQIDPLLDRLRSGDIPSDEQVFGTSLVEFIRERGGIQPYGELADADYGNRPFQRNLIQRTGMSADAAAEAAVEAGYFPRAGTQGITESELFDALDDELRGAGATYTEYDADPQLFNLRNQLLQLDDYLSQLGIDITQITDNAQVRQLIEQAVGQGGEGPQLFQLFGDMRTLPEQIEVDGVMRPTSNSEGRQIHPTQEGVINFWRWFGESKVVDEQGRPLVAYHGTLRDFEAFDQSAPKGSSVPNATDYLGIFFSTSAQDAAKYSQKEGANIIPAFLSIQNPLPISVDKWRSMSNSSKGHVQVRNLLKKAEENGNDGFVVEGKTRTWYVAIRPEQIKSATGNDGTFGADTGNILFQDGQDVRNLVALHNLSAENLEFVDRIGGIPVPSLGITKVDSAFEGFGEITLIGARDLIDPARGVPVFSADAYTTRFPDVIWKKVPTKKAQAFLDKYRQDADATDDRGRGSSMVWDSLVNTPNRDRAITELERSLFGMHAFLRSKGVPFEMPMRKPAVRYQWSNDPELRAFVEADKSRPRKFEEQASVYMRSNGEEGPGPELVEFSRIVRASVDRYLIENPEGKALADAIGYEEARAAAATNWGLRGDWINTDAPVPWKVTTWIEDDFAKGTDLVPDDTKAGEILRQEVAKFGDEYRQWAVAEIKALFDEPKIKVGRKQVPLTLDNIVEAMTSRSVRNEEKTMTFSSGQVSAATAKRFMSIKEIQAARDRVVSPEQEKAMKETVDGILESYRMSALDYFTQKDYRGQIDTWAGLDAAMKSLADAHKSGGGEQSIRRALASNGFRGFDEDVVEQAREAILAMRGAVTDYFEAKPQRAVMLDEFVGAAVPENASAKTIEILERNGLRVEKYAENNRQQVIAGLSRQLDDESGGVLFQGEGLSDKRGFIQFGRDRKFNITLLEKADLSTFLHESGHFYLEVLGDLAEMPDANQQIKDDFATVLKFLGAKSRADITLDGKKPGSAEYARAVEMHEKFARANEAYLMEGKAPSEELRSIFQRFKSWLKLIYREFSKLNVELTNDVRAVFDRIYASDQEIEAAKRELDMKPMFLDAAQAGMTEAEFEAYKQSVAQATERGKEALQAKIMRELQREREAWYKAELEKVRAEVEAEVDAQPVYEAFKQLTEGDIKLNKDELIERYGAEYVKRLPRGFQRVYTRGQGMPLDAAAQLLNYPSGDAMVEALVGMRPRNELIRAEADARMKELYGDMILDGTIADEALMALHNAEREQVLAAELRALRRKQREVAPFLRTERQAQADQRRQARAATDVPPTSAFRAAARGIVGQTAIRDLEPGRYLNAQRKHARLAFNAMASGDYQSAADAKQKEILNHFLYLEARDARERADKVAKHMRDLEKRDAQERLGKAGKTYLDQINAILDGYEFRRIPNRQIDRRASLQAFVAQQEADGNPVNIPFSVLEDARQVNYRQLTTDELEAIYEAVRNIENLARLKNRLTLIAEKRTLDEVAGEAIAQIRENAKGGKAKKLESNLPGEQAGRWARGFMLIHTKFATLFRQMDGWKDGGMLWDLFVRPLNERADFEAVQRAEATKKMRELFKAYRDTNMFAKKHIPSLGQAMSLQGRLMVALNWGRAENRQRLRDGNGLSQQNIDEIFATLDERDWQFVQGVWNLFDSYWPLISDQYERLYGVAPQKSDALPFQTKFGDMDGGYFPIKYDPIKSERATAFDADEVAQQMKSGAFMRSQTKNGFTKEVLQNVDRAVRLDFSSIYEHLDEVIHDLALREYLLDTNKLLNHRVENETLKDVIFDTYGDQFYTEIRDTLRDVAVGDIGARGQFEQAMSHIRSGVTIVGMGWNLMTGLMQPLGLTQSMVRVGPKWVAKGLAKWGSDIVSLNSTTKWVYEKSDFMRTRNLTQNREINEIRNQIKRQGKFPLAREVYGMVEDSYFQLIIQLQKVVDIPTWLGAYEKALEQGADDARAVALANQAVIDSQSGGAVKDLAKVQRGGPLMKLWTTFYSYFNTTFNLTREAFGKTNFRDPVSIGRLAVDVLMLYTVPAILGYALREGVNISLGGEGDEDEELIEALLREQLGYVLGTMVGLRELSGFITRPEFGYTGPAGARFFAEATKLAQQVQQGELDQALAKAANNFAGMLLHYPAGAVNRAVLGINALAEGETSNPAAVLFGPPKQ